MELGAAEDLESEVAAAFEPFIGLFSQDRTDEADDRIAVGEDRDGVRASADLAVEALLGGCSTRSVARSPSGTR